VRDPDANHRFRQLYEPLAASTLATWGDRRQRAERRATAFGDFSAGRSGRRDGIEGGIREKRGGRADLPDRDVAKAQPFAKSRLRKVPWAAFLSFDFFATGAERPKSYSTTFREKPRRLLSLSCSARKAYKRAGASHKYVATCPFRPPQFE